jgi:hypothetical protein
VVVQAGDGKNSMSYKQFDLQIELNGALLDAAMQWLEKDWFVVCILTYFLLLLV